MNVMRSAEIQYHRSSLHAHFCGEITSFLIQGLLKLIQIKKSLLNLQQAFDSTILG